MTLRRIVELLPPDPLDPPPGRDVRFADAVARRHAWAAREVRQIEFRRRLRDIGQGVSCVATAAAGATGAFRSLVEAAAEAGLRDAEIEAAAEAELEALVTALDAPPEPR